MTRYTKASDDMGWLNGLMERVTSDEEKIAEAHKAAERDRLTAINAELSRRLPARHLSTAGALLADRSATGKVWTAAKVIMAKGEHISGTDGIFLSGPKGCGKTTAAVAMGLDAAHKGIMPWYIMSTRFARIVKATEHDKPNLSCIESCGLLIIDELHRVDGLPDWVKTPLIGVIDYRYSQNLQTIAAGTLPLGELAKVLGEEVIDRFKTRISSGEDSKR